MPNETQPNYLEQDIPGVSSETVNTIRGKSVAELPDRPQQYGFTAGQVKEAFIAPITDTTGSVVSELNRIIAAVNALKAQLKAYADDELDTKQDNLTFDDAPEFGSDNPVKSGGIYAALGEKQDTLEFDNRPAENSQKMVKSGGIYDAIQAVRSAIAGLESEGVLDILALKADLVGGKVPASQLPSYVDDVLEYNSLSDFPATGEDSKIYVAKDTNLTYRWSGSEYVNLSSPLALGETPSTAFAGNRGVAAEQAIYALQTALNALKSSLIEEANSLPTATASSPDFVQVVETLYRKVTTTEGNQTTYAYESIIDDVPIQSGTGDKSLIQKIAGDTDHVASAPQSISLQGKSKATAPNGVAIGYRAEANGENAVALGGYKAKANGENAFANGNTVNANGDGSNSFGSQNTSDADYSSTRGKYTHTESTATYGEASGFGTNVRNVAEHAVGKYNDDDANNTDRLFSVGNGTGGANRHNAFEAGGSIGNEYIKVGDLSLKKEDFENILRLTDMYYIEFKSNGDGTCYARKLSSAFDKDTLYIPSTSPIGDKVTSVHLDDIYPHGNIKEIHIPATVTELYRTNSLVQRAVGYGDAVVHYYGNLLPTLVGGGSTFNGFFHGNTIVVMESPNAGLSEASYPQNRPSNWAGAILCRAVEHVRTADDLRSIATRCNVSHDIVFGNTLFLLDNDIDISGSDWVSIGTNTYPFTGDFYGNGHTITGLTQRRGYINGGSSSTANTVGLFGVVSPSYNNNPYFSGCVIRDFKVTGSIIGSSGGQDAGTVISMVKPGIEYGSVYVRNIWSTINFDTSSSAMNGVGGIVGDICYVSSGNMLKLYISGCRYSGTLNSPSAGSNKYGGIMGWTRENPSPRTIEIANCLFDGTMILYGANPDDCGGIIGYLKGNSSSNMVKVSIGRNLVTGQFHHKNKSGVAYTGYILSEASRDSYSVGNTDYDVGIDIYNIYCNDSDRHTGADLGGWYGYGTIPACLKRVEESVDVQGNPITITAEPTKNIPASMSQITSGGILDIGNSWHYEAGHVPVPAALYEMFGN